MSKSLQASQKLMQTYLSELLTEEDQVFAQPPVKEKALEGKKLEQLLEKVNTPEKEPEQVAEPVLSRKQEPLNVEAKAPAKPTIAKPVVKAPPISTPKVAEKKAKTPEKVIAKNYRKGSFQAMFFDVAGLTIAVPLIELGGIYNVDKINTLVGKPDWFKGVMLHRDDKINVVDTALWVMPDKCDQTLMDNLNYKYVIMLGDSHWGLMAENLVDTVTLEQEDVKWLDNTKKRPWLAGLVKDRMCALLEVDAFIRLLNEGMNVNAGESI